MVEELETLPSGPSDVASITTALAENACDGDGSKRFEVIEPSEGQEYEDCHRALEAERVKTNKHGELLGTIEYFKAHQNGLMRTMERKNRMMDSEQALQGGRGEMR